MHGSPTPKIRFSEPRLCEILDLMNKLQLPFSYFTIHPDSILGIDSIYSEQKGSEPCSLNQVLGVLLIELLNSDTIF